MFCGACGKIQPVDDGQSYFELFDVPRSMNLSREELDRRFRGSSKKVHPDRFGAHSSVERKLALQHTARLNEAHQVLKDPERRAEYLMSLSGVKVGSEEARTTDAAFLMEMLELQEGIESASPEELERHRKSIADRRRLCMDTLERHFDTGAGTKKDALDALDELRYLRRLVDRIDVRLEEGR